MSVVPRRLDAIARAAVFWGLLLLPQTLAQSNPGDLATVSVSVEAMGSGDALIGRARTSAATEALDALLGEFVDRRFRAELAPSLTAIRRAIVDVELRETARLEGRAHFEADVAFDLLAFEEALAVAFGYRPPESVDVLLLVGEQLTPDTELAMLADGYATEALREGLQRFGIEPASPAARGDAYSFAELLSVVSRDATGEGARFAQEQRDAFVLVGQALVQEARVPLATGAQASEGEPASGAPTAEAGQGLDAPAGGGFAATTLLRGTVTLRLYRCRTGERLATIAEGAEVSGSDWAAAGIQAIEDAATKLAPRVARAITLAAIQPVPNPDRTEIRIDSPGSSDRVERLVAYLASQEDTKACELRFHSPRLARIEIHWTGSFSALSDRLEAIRDGESRLRVLYADAQRFDLRFEP